MWSTVIFPAVVFIPVCNLKSCVVFTKATVDFGSTTGHDSVYVIISVD